MTKRRGKGFVPAAQLRGSPQVAAQDGRTVDESVDDELAVLFHQVVDVTENATAREKLSY